MATTRAPIPLPAEPEALLALYARAHGLVVGRARAAIAESERALREAPADAPAGLLAALERAAAALRACAAGYEKARARHALLADEPSLETVRCFIRNVQATEAAGDDPAFDFLFAAP